MSVRGQLLHMLEVVAEALGDDLLARLVFVGGCSTALFITDTATLEDVRATDDIDLIIDLAGQPAWIELQGRLREKGFRESQDDDVICRMRLGNLKVDFMPDDATILGFTNRWYRKGIETAEPHVLTDGLTILRLTSPLFVATKLEAYLGRGGGDLLGSRDMEDILLIVDGRPELLEEVRAADAEVRRFISEQITGILASTDFDYFLAGNIRGPDGRQEIVYQRLVALGAGKG